METGKLIANAETALGMWAEHERGGVRAFRPDGYERPSVLYGLSENEQASAYVSGTRLYRAAYPVLWWEWLHGERIESFDPEEYLLRREPWAEGAALERVTRAPSCRDRFMEHLGDRLRLEPLEVFPRSAGECGHERIARLVFLVETKVRQRAGVR